MGAADEVKVVLCQELLDHVGSKGEADAAVVFAPARDVRVWVRPQQVAQQPSVRNVRRPRNPPDLQELRVCVCGARVCAVCV